ncbi:CHAT domain-containing protein [Mycolicibacterium sp.]|uniref:CHAT domain-containing protein n=1 Tax=Mycolicibacterium sp. TaxID=2320850 RepID=UPI0037C6B4E8
MIIAGYDFISITEITYVHGTLDKVVDGLVKRTRPRTDIVVQIGAAEIRVFLGADRDELLQLCDNRVKLRAAIRQAPVVDVLHGTDGRELQRRLQRLPEPRVVAVMSGGSAVGILIAHRDVRHAPAPGGRVHLDGFGGAILPEMAEALPDFGPPPPVEVAPAPPPRRRRSRARAAAAPEPAADTVLERTPHLDAPDRLPKAADSRITVTVYLDEAPMAEQEDGRDVVITAPESVTEIALTVELVTSPHFRHRGGQRREVTLKRSEKRTAEATFELEVTADAPRRPAGMLAQFSYNGRPSGFVSRAWDWTVAASEAPEIPGHAAAASSLPIHVESVAPDVTVKVTAPVADGQHYVCSVESPLLPAYQAGVSAEFGLPETAAEFVAKKLDGLIDESRSATERRRNLKEAGYRFWKAAPPTFQKLIWDLIDANVTVKNLYIATAEPTLPWELMIPHRVVAGFAEERAPLGVEFAIGRWTRSDSASPPQRLPVSRTFVVAPRYEGERKLASADDEVTYMTQNLRGIKIEDASIDGLDRYFQDNSASLLHFVCHGASDQDNFDAVLLLDNEQELRSDTILALDGFKALCRRRAPMVFLNACQTGMSIPALVGGAGFPVAFSDIGARAILAPLWPVDDTLAHQFAVEVYQTALTSPGTPIAEIVRRVRQRAYDDEDADTYAAYAFFGDPSAVLELVDG